MPPELATTAPEQTAPATTAPATTEPAVATPTPVTVVETPKPSLDEVLSKKYDELNAPPKDAKASPAPGAVETPKAEGEGAEPTSDQPANAEPEPTQSSSAIAAPNSWSAEAKADWSKLPPSAQAYISRREGEFHRAITSAGQELAAFEPLRPIYQALNEHWNVPRGKEAEAITSWARAQAYLDSNPVEALKWLAQSYKVDPAQLVGQPKPAEAPKTDSVDDLFKDSRLDSQVLPVVQALQKQVAEQQEALRYFYGQQQTRETAEVQRRNEYASEVITNFSKDKPYFAELEDVITKEVGLIKRDDPKLPPEKVLEQAYDNAVWKTKPVRERILEDQRKQAEAKSNAEAVKKQAEAKKHAGMNVRTGASASGPAAPAKFLDDGNLSALFDRIQAS